MGSDCLQSNISDIEDLLQITQKGYCFTIHMNDIEMKPAVSAADVKAKIQDALKRKALIDASHINVEASGSRVTLHGDVESWAEREEAEDTTWGAPGVSEVTNEIRVS